MNFEEYKKEVEDLGRRIEWKFNFVKKEMGDIELQETSEGNIKPIKLFTFEYVKRNLEWKYELDWLKIKIKIN